jgi:hypothetical protein
MDDTMLIALGNVLVALFGERYRPPPILVPLNVKLLDIKVL